MKANQTYPKPISRPSSQPNTDGISRTSSFSDSELLSVVTDQLDSVWLMTTNNTSSSMNQTSDWESSPFSPRETPRESQKSNSKEKSKNQEEPKREKSLPPERSKLKAMSEELKKNTLRNSSDSISKIYLISNNFPVILGCLYQCIGFYLF